LPPKISTFPTLSNLLLNFFKATLNAEEVQAIARHFTTAETYFFREPRAFDELEAVLPSLIEMRRGQGKKLRILSAGCCTGEEAYSLAMLLTRLNCPTSMTGK
jgi:chemotaxis protein methyltransferase CheR